MKNHEGKHKTLLGQSHAPETQTHAHNHAKTHKSVDRGRYDVSVFFAKDQEERLGADSQLYASLLGGERTLGTG